AAKEIVAVGEAADKETFQQEHRFQGPRPAIAGFASDNDQMAWIVASIYDAARDLRLPLGAAAILTCHNSQAEQAASMARELGLPARYMKSRDIDVRALEVKVITMHSAKGLEFPILAVPFLS